MKHTGIQATAAEIQDLTKLSKPVPFQAGEVDARGSMVYSVDTTTVVEKEVQRLALVHGLPGDHRYAISTKGEFIEL